MVSDAGIDNNCPYLKWQCVWSDNVCEVTMCVKWQCVWSGNVCEVTMSVKWQCEVTMWSDNVCKVAMWNGNVRYLYYIFVYKLSCSLWTIIQSVIFSSAYAGYHGNSVFAVDIVTLCIEKYFLIGN